MIVQFRKSPAYDCDKYGGMSVAVPPVEQYLPLLFLLPSCSFRPANFLPARCSIPSKAGEVVAFRIQVEVDRCLVPVLFVNELL